MGVFKLDMSSGKITHIEQGRVRLDSYTVYVIGSKVAVKIANVLNDEPYQDIVIMDKSVFDQELFKKIITTMIKNLIKWRYLLRRKLGVTPDELMLY